MSKSKIRRRLKNQKGFTLMELMVVVLILGIISAYAIPTYLSSIRTAKLGQVIANYGAARTETWSAYYAPGSDEESAAKAAGQNLTSLTNPFGASSATRQPVVITDDGGTTYEYWTGSAWASYDGDGTGSVNLGGGEVVLNYETSGEITVAAYDDSSTPASMESETITDPRL